MDRYRELVERVKREFGFQSCFLCARRGDPLVLSEGDSETNFFPFLEDRLTAKDNAYFSEVRFFRYKTGSERAQEHLALIPIQLEQLPFAFLGITYRNLDMLDQLLKLRILPAYLTQWLQTIAIEQGASPLSPEHLEKLVNALEEKRQYTFALENKLSDLKQKIEDIQSLKGGKDVEIFALRELLDKQVADYRHLVARYQELFEEYDSLEKEYLAAVVQFETQFHLTRKLQNGDVAQELKQALGNEAEVRQQLQKANAKSHHYQAKYQQILKSFAGWSPDQLQEFQEKVKAMTARKEKKI